MKSICVLSGAVSLVAMVLSTAIAEPATQPSLSQPTSAPAWVNTELGKRVLVPFASAPFPDESRAEGYTNSAGESFSAAIHYSDSTVGIFVPAGFKPGETVDYVFYFHGHRNHVENVFTQFQLAERLVAAKVNAILIVPQGPKLAPDSGGGKMEREGGFQRLVNDITRYLQAEQILSTDRVGRIILCPHSGGYRATAAILARGGLTDHISDVLLFDASYANLPMFADFAKAHRNARLVSFHTKHLDARNAELRQLLDDAQVPYRVVPEAELQPDVLRAPGVMFVSTTKSHSGVVDYLQLMLETAGLERLP